MGIWHAPPDDLLTAYPPPQTLAHHLGIELIELGDDFLRARMPVDGRTRQPMGLLHGGASVALGETLMSFAARLTLDRARFGCVGMSISANHLRSVREGWVVGTARPIHRGRGTQVWTCDVNGGEARGPLISTAHMTVRVVPLAASI